MSDMISENIRNQKQNSNQNRKRKSHPKQDGFFICKRINIVITAKLDF